MKLCSMHVLLIIKHFVAFLNTTIKLCYMIMVMNDGHNVSLRSSYFKKARARERELDRVIP
jgi:pantothenate synthetase